MKIIITEQQHDRLKKAILKYLDNNLTPHGGWEKTKSYKKELKNQDNELFLHLTGNEFDSDNHMWYSTYNNPHVGIKKEDSPIVLIPDSKAIALDGYFGDMWKPIFIEWFENNSGLKVKKVDEFGWGKDI